jgi:O-antigen/teichoic acid export membrane protein
MRNLLGIRILLAAAGVGAAVAFAAAAGYDRTMVVGAALAGVAVFATSVQSTFFVPLLAELRLGTVTILELVRQGTTAAAIVAGVVAGAGLLTFFALPILPALLVLAATVAVVARSVPIRPGFDRKTWAPLVRATLPVAIASIASIVYYRVAVIVMSLVASGEQTGFFSVSFRIVEVLIMVPNLLVSGVFPVLAHAAQEDDRRLAYVLQRLFDVSIIGGAWTTLSVVVGAPFAIDVIAGPKFHPSVDVLRLQGLALGATFLIFAWGYALLALHRTRGLIYANAFGIAVVLVATLILGKAYGAKGAAGAVVIAEVALAFAYGLLIRKAMPVRFSLDVLWKVLVAVGLAAAVPLLAPLPSAALLVLTTVVFVAAVVLLRAIPSELRDAFRRG